MLELSNVFHGKLNENHQVIKGMRGRYNALLSIYRDLQEDSKLFERNADARARVLQDNLTTAEEDLEACRDDLFRTQPVCQTSDASIIDAFKSLGEQLINWIDDQASAFEYVNPDVDAGSNFLLKLPSAGEYLCRHIVNQYLSERVFGPSIYVFGLPAEYKHIIAGGGSGLEGKIERT